MRRSTFLVVLVPLIVAAQSNQPSLRLLGLRGGRLAQVVKGAPFSAEITTESTQVLPDGNRIRQTSSERIYRDSEGRTRRERSLAALESPTSAGNAPQLAFIDDPVAGASYALDLSARTVTRSAFRQPPARPARQNGASAVGVRSGGALSKAANIRRESLGRQMIAGVQADGIRTTQTIPAGQIGNALAIQIVTERWYSSELQMVVLLKRSDPRAGETVYQLSNISRAEPPSTLFSPPVDFQATQSSRLRMRASFAAR